MTDLPPEQQARVWALLFGPNARRGRLPKHRRLRLARRGVGISGRHPWGGPDPPEIPPLRQFPQATYGAP